MPVLSDGHVLLRAAGARDLPEIEVGIHDPDVARWIGPPEPSAQVALERNTERWARGSPTLAICDLDGTFRGLVWLNMSETDPSTGSIGYWLLPVARGRGSATSAVRLLVDWAFRELGVTRLRITTALDNARSQRVAERGGFRRERPNVEAAGDPERSDQVAFFLDADDLTNP